MTTPKKLFILYDGRAKHGSTDDATVLQTADSEGEARRDSRITWKQVDAIWFEYDVDGKNLVNERKREDLGGIWLR